MSCEAHLPLTESGQLHLLGDEGILYCPLRKQIYHLNTSAAYIWCASKEGLTSREIAEALVKQFGLPPDLASQHVNDILQAPVGDGRCEVSPSRPRAGSPQSAESGTVNPQALPPVPPPAAYRQQVFNLLPILNFEPVGRWRRYRLGALDFLLRYPSAILQSRVHAALAHLELEPLATTDGEDEEAPLLSIDIRHNGGSFDLYCDNEVSAKACTEAELAPRIHGLLLLSAYENSGCLAAVHAAAVGNGERCLLLPAASGSGKSTLVAAMASMGHDYLTDELVLLSADGAISPLPVSLGLKPDSWKLLEPIFPELDQLPVHLQEKGTKVRYLRPARVNPRTQWYDIAAVVFPRFVPGAQTQLTTLSAAESMRRLADSGYAVPGGLDPEVVAGLLDWISRQQCYELQVGNLYRAVEIAGELL